MPDNKQMVDVMLIKQPDEQGDKDTRQLMTCVPM